MPRIDSAQVRHIAKLARLNLTAAEAARFTVELGRIVEYVGQLAAVPTDGVEPLALPVAIRDVVRPDHAATPLSAAAATQNAPQTIDSLFAVPAVLDAGQ